MIRKLDKRDISIMWKLFQNSRTPLSKIAKNVGVPKETVNYRIQQLERRGIIKNYYAITDTSQFGFLFYEIFVKLQGIPAEYEAECLEKLGKHEFVSWLVSTSGRFSFACTILVKNAIQFYEAYSYIKSLFGKYIKDIFINVAVEGQQFEYPFFKNIRQSPIKTKKFVKHHDYSKLDKLDLGLLNLLSRNCRTPLKRIANELKTTEKTIRSRMKILEKNKTIVQYTTNFHPGRVGYFFYIILISLRQPNKELEEFIRKIPELFYLVKGIGFFDLKIEFYLEDENRVHEIEESIYQKFGNNIINMDIIHVKHEYIVRYFTEA